MFAAKAVVFAAVSLVTGLVASFGSFFLGQAILSSHHLNVTLSQPNVLRAVIGGALFLTACGMLAYGLGAILRHTAAAITAAIGLLFVLSILVNFLPRTWQDHVNKWMPAIRLAAALRCPDGRVAGTPLAAGAVCGDIVESSLALTTPGLRSARSAGSSPATSLPHLIGMGQ